MDFDPEKITLKWLADHVPVTFWLSAVGALVTTFVSGVYVGQIGWVKTLLPGTSAPNDKDRRTAANEPEYSGGTAEFANLAISSLEHGVGNDGDDSPSADFSYPSSSLSNQEDEVPQRQIVLPGDALPQRPPLQRYIEALTEGHDKRVTMIRGGIALIESRAGAAKSAFEESRQQSAANRLRKDVSAEYKTYATAMTTLKNVSEDELKPLFDELRERIDRLAGGYIERGIALTAKILELEVEAGASTTSLDESRFLQAAERLRGDLANEDAHLLSSLDGLRASPGDEVTKPS